jgi:hypothetical protein
MRAAHGARVVRLTPLALAVLIFLPSVAEAQLYLPPLPTAEELALEDARQEERDLTGAWALRDTGAGMALGGMLTMGLGVAFMTAPAGFENWSGIIVGSLGQSLGGLSLLIGLPMWIVGDVREHILSASLDERLATAERWELAGMVTTLTGLGLMLLGGALMAAGATLRDLDAQTPLVTGGAAGLNVGLLLATFIGPAMWGEGARF